MSPSERLLKHLLCVQAKTSCTSGVHTRTGEALLDHRHVEHRDSAQMARQPGRVFVYDMVTVERRQSLFQQTRCPGGYNLPCHAFAAVV